MPGLPEWEQLTDEQRDAIDEVLVNVGKAIEGYEHRLQCRDTRFDRWVRGEVTFSTAEEAGAATFVQEGCIRCHSSACNCSHADSRGSAAEESS